jgi:hypothetical protein
VVTKIRLGLAAAVALAVLLELVLPRGASAHAPIGFYALYGFAGCVVLVVVAKRLGKLGLQAPEPPASAEELAPLDPGEETLGGPGPS